MQPGIEDQLALEQKMVNIGIERYNAAQQSAEESGRGAETTYARRLIQTHLLTLAEGIQEFLDTKQAVRMGKVRKLIDGIDPDKAAYFLLRGVFQSWQNPTHPIQNVVVAIGQMVEDELRFSRFRELHKDYYEAVLEDFKRKGTRDYRRMHRVLTFKANEKQDNWNPWAQEERAMVGAKLLDILMSRTQLAKREILKVGGKRYRDMTVLRPTDEAVEWIKKHTEYMEMMDPFLMPCVIEPDPWTAFDQGGYYSPELRSQTRLVLNSSKRYDTILRRSDLSEVMSAVNRIQGTPWRVNRRVFETMREVWHKSLGIGMPPSEPYEIPACPFPPDLGKKQMNAEQLDVFMAWKTEAAYLHTQERERISKCFQVARAIRMAGEFEKYEKFWFVYQCDFRGRIYAATAGFSPQGSDTTKALIEFADGKALGKDGMFWLMVHGANSYGYDKDTFEGRVQFIQDMHSEIIAVAEDPINNRSVWANADGPWQFLAFCFEYADAVRNPQEFLSHLPIAMDGSCNGLQHFSAMLRDSVGGTATNLVPMSKPADIYTAVAKVCTRKLQGKDDEKSALWVHFCNEYGKGEIPRKLAKKPVMTLPYGSTQRACTDSIFQYVFETNREWFKEHSQRDKVNETYVSAFAASVHLTPILWESIGDVVIAARAAMDWIRGAAGQLAKDNHPLLWHTPTGWPVFQANYEIEARCIDTQICGRLQLRIGKFTDTLDVNRMRNGASPNFVHSMDASHLVKTVHLMPEGTSFAMIHDSYGCHAADMPALGNAIRTAFLGLYTASDPLADLRTELSESTGVDLPELPSRGDLDLSQVLASRYFFS